MCIPQNSVKWKSEVLLRFKMFPLRLTLHGSLGDTRIWTGTESVSWWGLRKARFLLWDTSVKMQAKKHTPTGTRNDTIGEAREERVHVWRWRTKRTHSPDYLVPRYIREHLWNTSEWRAWPLTKARKLLSQGLSSRMATAWPTPAKRGFHLPE